MQGRLRQAFALHFDLRTEPSQPTVASSSVAEDQALFDHMDSARRTLPYGDCIFLSQELIRNTDRGVLVAITPRGPGFLPTLPGVASEPWANHAGVLIPDGRVVDPLLRRIYPSVESFRRAIVGDLPVNTMINGAMQP